MNKTVVAVVQWKPSVHDVNAGTARACDAIAEGAKQGAKLVVFPELWLQGYPYWAGNSVRDPAFQGMRPMLFESAISIPGPETDKLCEAARTHRCIVVMSAHERVGGTLYNSQFFIDEQGELLGSHRKLVPTTTERLVHGRGDGSDLDAYDTSIGKLSGLLCYEHMMGPARYALCDLGTEIHAAAWPGHAFLDPMIDAAMRHLSFENGCFSIVAREVMDMDGIAKHMPADRGEPSFWEAHGGSAIIAPTGEYLAGPVFDEETLVIAELDPSAISFAKWWVDGTGHYSRPDVFQLRWNRRPKPPVVVET